MDKKRIFGLILIIIGILFPLYISTNMSLDYLRGERKYEKFLGEYEKINGEERENIRVRSREYNRSIGGDYMIDDPFEGENPKPSYEISDDPNLPFGHMYIPKIDLSENIYLGASRDHLNMGLGHVYGTSLPIGQIGRSVIAGHRGGINKAFLLYADRLEEGDILKIDLGGEILEYEMVSREVIKKDEWEKLKAFNNKDMVTLITCDPLITYKDRMLVNFERINEPKDLEKKLDFKGNIIEGKKEIFLGSQTDNINYMKYFIYIINIGLLLLLIILIFKVLRVFLGYNRKTN